MSDEFGCYVLVYQIKDYHECGGGLYYERFRTKEEVLGEIKKHAWNDKFKLILAGLLKETYNLKPVEVVTEWVLE